MINQEKISRKCKYALKAIFELAMLGKAEPIRIRDIASAQSIPRRFLEAILSELKHGGFVESRRGSDGGYLLARSPAAITVGQVLRFLRKGASFDPQRAQATGNAPGDLAFLEMYRNVNDAVAKIYDNTTFADLVERDLEMRYCYSPNYTI